MRKAGIWLAMIGLGSILLSVSYFEPRWLDDDNYLLGNWANHEMLSTLALIAAVTLASSSTLHLELTKLRDETGWTFDGTKATVKKCAYSLMVLLGAAVVIVIGRPWLGNDAVLRAAMNSVALLILFLDLHVLYALTRSVFAIPSLEQIKKSASDAVARP